MPSYGCIACHHCIQDYYLLNWPIRNLPNCAKVFVVFRTGPVEPMPKGFMRNMNLRFQTTQRHNLEAYGLDWK